MRFQYADRTEWLGPPEKVRDSPDKGVIRMWGIDDEGRRLEFVYDDFYYIYRDEDGGWVLGSGTPKREFAFHPGEVAAIERPVDIPDGAVVRMGQTVSQEEAVAFGLVEPGGKTLSQKRDVRVRGRP